MEPDDEIPNWRQLLFLAWKNRDRVLAFCQVTVGAVQTAGGVVPEYHMKYWLLASGLSLTMVPVVELTKWITGRKGRRRRQAALAG